VTLDSSTGARTKINGCPDRFVLVTGKLVESLNYEVGISELWGVILFTGIS
jgi:hypothetical protein